MYDKFLERLHDKASYAETMKIEAEEAAKKAAKKAEEAFREDEKRGIALNLIKMNFPVVQVTQATGLEIEEVKKLRNHK